jgi:hypothetical protein
VRVLEYLFFVGSTGQSAVFVGRQLGDAVELGQLKGALGGPIVRHAKGNFGEFFF